MNTSFDKMLENVEWGEYKLGDLFEIQRTKGFNKESLTVGQDYDYVTRTSQNNGVLQKTGFVDERNINSAGSWSLGLLQMIFFYRPKPWYAGQFVRKIRPKIDITTNSIFYFTAILNKHKKKLLSVLVRDVNKVFNETQVKLPISNGEIDFEFIDRFIEKFKAKNSNIIQEYLSVTGLKDCALTSADQSVLNKLETTRWASFKIEDILDWQVGISELNPLHLDSLSVSEEKKYPFYGQSTSNNGVIEYRHLKEDALNNKLSKPTILIHSNNQNTVYLETPFYLKDGHGATSVLQSEHLDKMNAQFIIASIKKVISKKFAYNNKATKIALKNTEISLPIQENGEPDYDFMSCVMSAIQKLVIKDVVLYADKMR